MLHKVSKANSSISEKKKQSLEPSVIMQAKEKGGLGQIPNEVAISGSTLAYSIKHPENYDHEDNTVKTTSTDNQEQRLDLSLYLQVARNQDKSLTSSRGNTSSCV